MDSNRRSPAEFGNFDVSIGWSPSPPWLCRLRIRSAPGGWRAFPFRPAPGSRRDVMSQTRRLAAILAADVAGYSRLMGADESGTLRRIKAIRAQLIDPKIAEHHGRLVKTT